MSKGWEKFFFFFTYLTQGSHYLSPRAYAIMHRMHHAYADTEMDPHSPNFSKNVFSMMWRTRNFYNGIFSGKIKVEEKFTKNLPEWNALDRWADSYLSRAIWIALYIVFFVHFVTAPWQWIFFPVLLVMAAFHGAIINWFAHKFGYKNFKVSNTSENLFSIDILMLGEAYHNNHHKFPSKVNFGHRWHELDPVYPIILLFDKIGIIQIPKKAPVQSGGAIPIKKHEHELAEEMW